MTCCCVEFVHARHLFEDNADLDQTPRVDMIIFLSLISSQIKIYIYGHINNLLIELQAVTCCCVKFVHARHFFEGDTDLDQTLRVDMIIVSLVSNKSVYSHKYCYRTLSNDPVFPTCHAPV